VHVAGNFSERDAIDCSGADFAAQDASSSETHKNIPG